MANIVSSDYKIISYPFADQLNNPLPISDFYELVNQAILDGYQVSGGVVMINLFDPVTGNTPVNYCQSVYKIVFDQ